MRASARATHTASPACASDDMFNNFEERGGFKLVRAAFVGNFMDLKSVIDTRSAAAPDYRLFVIITC